MAQVKTLIAKYPLPPEKTPYWMQFANVAGGSPFELAAAFKIWQELTAQQQREIEKARNSLAAAGEALRIWSRPEDPPRDPPC